MLDIPTGVKVYYDEVVAFAKKFGLYEPVAPRVEVGQRYGSAYPGSSVVLRVFTSGEERRSATVGSRQWPEGELMTMSWQELQSQQWDLWHKEHDDKQYLKKALDYVGASREDRKLVLTKDFAPFSFGFEMYRPRNLQEVAPEWVFMFNGAIIYHGPHDRNGMDNNPTLAVSLTPCDGWSVHT